MKSPRRSPLPLFCLVLLALAGPVDSRSETKPKRAPIWKLEDADSTVFLAGSVHLLRADDMPIPEIFDEIYDKVDEVVFEIDLSEMARPGSAERMKQAGSLPAGESIEDHLSEETLAGLAAYLEKHRLPANLFEGSRPGMIFLTLGSLEALRQGARPELGVETRYYRKSANDGKPSRGLETMAFQISRFDELDIEVLEDLIRETLEEAEESEDTLDEIIAAWKSGDEDRMADLIVDRLSEAPEVRRVLLTERNENWIPEIEAELAKSDDVLVIVGAAHLAGEDSVIDLLRERGHEVRQVVVEQ